MARWLWEDISEKLEYNQREENPIEYDPAGQEEEKTYTSSSFYKQLSDILNKNSTPLLHKTFR